MKKCLLLLLIILLSAFLLNAETGWEIIDSSGFKGGVIIHIGCGNGNLTLQLGSDKKNIVQGLDIDSESIKTARQIIKNSGSYGRISASVFNGMDLPYIDNFANLIVSEDLNSVTMDEVMRVLCPNGTAYIKEKGNWIKKTKPWPEEIDEWTHYMHDAGGNGVGRDKMVGSPKRMQWIGGPRWARSHEHTASLHALVSAKGRIFYIMDEGSKVSIQLPSNYIITARDAFNGTVLWKRGLRDWFNHLYPLKSGPAYMPRRLVAEGDTVYVSPGIGQDLIALDAVTGELKREYVNTKTAVDILFSGGTLFIVSDPDRILNDYKQENVDCWKERERASNKWAWKRNTDIDIIKAIDAETGNLLWEKKTPVAPMTLTANSRHVSYFNGESVACLDRKNGKELWIYIPENITLPPNTKKKKIKKARKYIPGVISTGYAPKLILSGNYIIYSPFRLIYTLNADSGEVIWKTAGKPDSGHFSPEDLFIIDDLLWAAGTARGKNSKFTAYDLKTGTVVKEYPCTEKVFFMHQRCYPGRATEKYLIPAATGTEFVDLETGKWEMNHWVRGGCIYGMMPCNGLLYAPPHACACYYQSKLSGFNALSAGKISIESVMDKKGRLEKGPAYSAKKNRMAINDMDWPVFRHDNIRSGYSKDTVKADLKKQWKINIGGKLSQPVTAYGKIYITEVDSHTVYALDEKTGKKLWSYITGGRIDSSPSAYKGMVIFGCVDGYVYALKADDGELVWRFRAAPADRKLMSYGQIESIWPISGSVLIQNGILYCIAGRSMFLDGGMLMLMLNPKTGKLLSETILDDKLPGTEQNLQYKMIGKHMPVALSDILTSDGKYIYMKSQIFNLDGKRASIKPRKERNQAGNQTHLFSPTSFIDDSWYHRSYWIYGKTAGEGWREWQIPGRYVPYGRILSVDENNAYGYARDPELLCNSSVLEYRLYSAVKKYNPERSKLVKDAKNDTIHWKNRVSQLQENQMTAIKYNWKIEHPPFIVRSMVITSDSIFAAGPPDIVDEKEMWGLSNDPVFIKKMKEQEEILKGSQGGLLWAVSKETGEKLAEYRLESMPAFDGMIVSNGRLFITMADGSLECWSP